MAYRDREKQRETTRERVRRYRSNQKALQEGVTKPSKALHKVQGVTGVTSKGDIEHWIYNDSKDIKSYKSKSFKPPKAIGKTNIYISKPNKTDTKPLTPSSKSITEHPRKPNSKQSQPPQPLHDKGQIEMLRERMKIGTLVSSDVDLPFSKSKQTKGQLR